MSAPDVQSRGIAFVDSNFWFYAFVENSEPNKHQIAEAFIQQTPDIAISVQVINEVSANLLKKASFSESDLRPLIRSFYQKYRVVPFDSDLLIRASELRERHQFSFWDSMIVAAALAVNATTLYTEDMHNGLRIDGSLEIVNPFLATSTT